MKVLVIGSGGREHALVWKIAQSKLVDKIFSAPGNGGIAGLAECIDIKADDLSGLRDFALGEKIDLTVVGPEAPLASGIVDQFQESKLKIFGPTQKAARLESSKVFSKELMNKYQVPTANFRIFDNPQEAVEFINQRGVPCVIKADGLAAGKGVVVCKTIEEAEKAVDYIMRQRVFGQAGEKIIVEDCLEGQEASIIVFTDSREVVPLASSQDHKRINDFDQGANTGGMGAYSPAPVVNDRLNHQIIETIIYPTIKGLVAEEIIYKGILYCGVMITSQGPQTLEFNVRFGDPETQAILPRLNSDLVEVMLATAQDGLSQWKNKRSGLIWDRRSCVCVVCASGGYPDKYEKGKEITGLQQAEQMADIVVFHAGTKKTDTQLVTNGGRVLGVTGLGNTIKEAIECTYQAVEKIQFQGMHYRKDIGSRAISKTE
ncbi:MAG: phosphoribosylamine--glycine ligase [Candidatus Omnitrophota bacterium]|jgi:phosphoribosylamine--glycine ligase